MEMVQYPDLLWYLTIIPWVIFFFFFFFFDLENYIKGQYYCKIPRTGYPCIRQLSPKYKRQSKIRCPNETV